MGKRARGANAEITLGYETTPGVFANGACFRMPIASDIELGDEQALIPSDLIGRGPEPEAPSDDVINNGGRATAPVDVRYIGLWLTMLLGEPTSTQGRAAKGTVTFSANPVNNATVTVNGQVFTFVTGNPAANQIKIGSTLAQTLENASIALNASVVAGVAAARYAVDLARTKLEIEHKTIGTSGNSFTLAASTSPVSNATVSGPTLAGGSASGPWNHVWESGSLDRPTASIELGFPEVPDYGLNTYVMAGGMTIELRRGGHLNAAIDLYAQGEVKASATHFSTPPTALTLERFSQFSGDVRVQGVPLGYLNGGRIAWSNGLDIDESIRSDGRTGGADAADLSLSGRASVRFADGRLESIADNRESVEVSHRWSRGADQSLTMTALAVRFPKTKAAFRGRGGVQKDFDWIGHRNAAGKSFRVVLVNDVASYDVP